ncbi:MAG: ABC transporter ATP-binding protein [Planctomycetaceae bacterium]|nr:ABC transporter ATP-binding protein [Planctomycetaceae bacterium]
MAIVSTHSLTKQYGELTALNACTVSTESGEVFGLLGPNGAGKTTLIRLLLGFLQPSSGRAEVAGFDCHQNSIKVRERVAYLPGEARLFRRMKGREVLEFFAQIRPGGNLVQSSQLAQHLDLDLRRRVAFMSTGMRQKLAIAVALANEAEVYILDEPTANLDPNVRRTVMELVREKRDKGSAVIISSHILSEMEESCDRVVILRSGKLVHTQIMSELRQRHRISAIAKSDFGRPPVDLQDRVSVSQVDDRLRIDTVGDLAELMNWIATLPLKDVTIEPSGLTSVYDRFHTAEAMP